MATRAPITGERARPSGLGGAHCSGGTTWVEAATVQRPDRGDGDRQCHTTPGELGEPGLAKPAISTAPNNTPARSGARAGHRRPPSMAQHGDDRRVDDTNFAGSERRL